jgi:hypothetical protein
MPTWDPYETYSSHTLVNLSSRRKEKTHQLSKTHIHLSNMTFELPGGLTVGDAVGTL